MQTNSAIDKVVSISCEGSGALDIGEMTEFQGDFKALTRENYNKLKKTILDLGFSDPINVWVSDDKNYILDGHQRKLVLTGLRAEGYLVPKIPVNYVYAENIQEAKKKVLTFSSNYGQITEESLSDFMIDAGIDADFLNTDVVLPEVNLDYFSMEDDQAGLTNEDDVPNPENIESRVKRGEVWILGNHRLMCGDSTHHKDLEILMNGSQANMVFTDPPYNIDYEGGTKKRETIENDNMDSGDFFAFLKAMYDNIYGFMVPGGSIYVCHADAERVNFTAAFRDAGFHLSSVIIWAKNNATFGRQDYFWKHEPILYGWNSSGSHKWYGPNNEETVWNIDRPSKSEIHPTMKPVALVERAIKNSCKQGEIVLDVFGGSGSTLIACEKVHRHCFTMELDESYCGAIIKRWEEFSGKSAILANP